MNRRDQWTNSFNYLRDTFFQLFISVGCRSYCDHIFIEFNESQWRFREYSFPFHEFFFSGILVFDEEEWRMSSNETVLAETQYFFNCHSFRLHQISTLSLSFFLIFNQCGISVFFFNKFRFWHYLFQLGSHLVSHLIHNFSVICSVCWIFSVQWSSLIWRLPYIWSSHYGFVIFSVGNIWLFHLILRRLRIYLFRLWYFLFSL